MDVHDRGMLYYRLLKYNVKEAQRVVCGQTKMVAEENTVIPRVPSQHTLSLLLSQNLSPLSHLSLPTPAFSLSRVQHPFCDVQQTFSRLHHPEMSLCSWVRLVTSWRRFASDLLLNVRNIHVVVPFPMQRPTLTCQWRPPARLPPAATPHFPLR